MLSLSATFTNQIWRRKNEQRRDQLQHGQRILHAEANRRHVRHFEYDPATTPAKAEDLGIKNYDTVDTDGLKSDWTIYKSIWCNPPFTIKHEFLKKAQEYYDKTGGSVYMLVPIGFLTTKRFHAICKGAKIFLPNGRIKYESGLGKPSHSPAFGSVVIKLDDHWSIEPLELA